MVGVKYIASISFGKDSLAMLLRLLEENYPLNAVVFYNTGMEFHSIYHIRDKVKIILQEKNIEYVELNPEAPFLFSMLEKPVKYRKRDGCHYGYGWCGGPCRWGTSYKIRAIRRYKTSLKDNVVDYVGIAADEQHRFEKEKSNGRQLPLVDLGMTESDCLSYCHERGWFWYEDTPSGKIDLYSILDRVSCWCCANKNRKELLNIYQYLPQYWDGLKELQAQIKTPMKKFCTQKNGFYGDVFSMERVFAEEIKSKNLR